MNTKTKILALTITTVFSSFSSFSQEVKFDKYLFINNKKDTIEAELGKFLVPENRSDSSSQEFAISFVRFKSTNPNPGSPIVYLAGGPGSSGVSTAKGDRFELFMKLREKADVIAYDQRGTGLSNILPQCPYAVSFDTKSPISRKEYVEKTIDNAQKCIAFWQEKGHDLSAYNTTENAFDLEDLRIGLGAKKVSLWGISYGSHLAFEYVRNFEDKVDRIVLASLEGPDETIKLPSNTEAFVDNICERAANNYGFEPKYPKLREVINSVHQKLSEEPQVVIYKARGDKLDTVGISNFELQSAVATFYLKNPDDSKKLPKLYTKMSQGDFSEIAPWVAILKKYVLNSISAMPFAMDMGSGISPERNKLVEKEIDGALLGSTINFLTYEWLNNLGFGQLPDEFRKLPENRVEALLLSGAMDGRTYVGPARKTAEAFLNGKHVVIDNAGHDLFMSSDNVGALILGFFGGEAVKISEIKIPPTPFD